jgi:hypothetical protein
MERFGENFGENLVHSVFGSPNPGKFSVCKTPETKLKKALDSPQMWLCMAENSLIGGSGGGAGGDGLDNRDHLAFPTALSPSKEQWRRKTADEEVMEQGPAWFLL